MSVAGATHQLAFAQAHTSRPDAASSVAQHRAELGQAVAEAKTQSIKTVDDSQAPRPRPQTSRHVDKTA